MEKAIDSNATEMIAEIVAKDNVTAEHGMLVVILFVLLRGVNPRESVCVSSVFLEEVTINCNNSLEILQDQKNSFYFTYCHIIYATELYSTHCSI